MAWGAETWRCSVQALTKSHSQAQAVLCQPCQALLLCGSQMIAVLLKISLQHLPHQHALGAEGARPAVLMCTSTLPLLSHMLLCSPSRLCCTHTACLLKSSCKRKEKTFVHVEFLHNSCIARQSRVRSCC